MAVVYPNEAALVKLAKSNDIEGENLETLVHNHKLNALVHQLLLASGKAGGLAGAEMLQGVVMCDEEWTPQNGLVTSAQKLNRRGIVSAHQKEIDQAYANNSA